MRCELGRKFQRNHTIDRRAVDLFEWQVSLPIIASNEQPLGGIPFKRRVTISARPAPNQLNLERGGMHLGTAGDKRKLHREEQTLTINRRASTAGEASPLVPPSEAIHTFHWQR